MAGAFFSLPLRWYYRVRLIYSVLEGWRRCPSIAVEVGLILELCRIDRLGRLKVGHRAVCSSSKASIMVVRGWVVVAVGQPGVHGLQAARSSICYRDTTISAFH